MAKVVKKCISVSGHLRDLIDVYAKRSGLSFSAAVSELCSAGLSLDADEPIAPRGLERPSARPPVMLHAPPAAPLV